jgi:hypothetical protein
MHFASRTVFWDSKAPSNKRRRSMMPFASHANEKAKLGPLSPRDSFLHGRCVRHVPATVVVGAEVEVVLSHRCRRDKAGLWGGGRGGELSDAGTTSRRSRESRCGGTTGEKEGAGPREDGSGSAGTGPRQRATVTTSSGEQRTGANGRAPRRVSPGSSEAGGSGRRGGGRRASGGQRRIHRRGRWRRVASGFGRAAADPPRPTRAAWIQASGHLRRRWIHR